jgi:hypothetical protein
MEPQRRKFTEEEDEALRALVSEHGPHRWDRIALFMPKRTGRQCRDRYCNYLCPGITQDAWTREEDELLREKYMELGPQWAKMKPFFQGRTGTALKNRWNYYLAKSMPCSNSKVVTVEPEKEEQKVVETEAGKDSLVDAIFGSLSSKDKLDLAVLEFGCFADNSTDPEQRQSSLFF